MSSTITPPTYQRSAAIGYQLSDFSASLPSGPGGNAPTNEVPRDERALMYLGKVIGSNWGAKQAAGLAGLKLLQVRPVVLRVAGEDEADARTATRLTEKDCALSDQVIVAADTLGAGPGEYVLVATGSRVRDLVYDTARPVKAVVVAVVDAADIDVGVVR
jgi:ethanolamine utilization protein EutN